jgi:hypothetical protein
MEQHSFATYNCTAYIFELLYLFCTVHRCYGSRMSQILIIAFPLMVMMFVSSITPGPNNLMLMLAGTRFGFVRQSVDNGGCREQHRGAISLPARRQHDRGGGTPECGPLR